MKASKPNSSTKAGSKVQRGKSKGRGQKTRPSHRDMMALRPLRNPALEWFEEEDRVVLHIKRVDNWKTKLLGLFTILPEERRVALDAIGTDVWRLTDGENTIDQIVAALARKYKLTPREVELSLQQFFKELSRRGYIGFFRPNAAEQTVDGEAVAGETAAGERAKDEAGDAQDPKAVEAAVETAPAKMSAAQAGGTSQRRRVSKRGA